MIVPLSRQQITRVRNDRDDLKVQREKAYKEYLSAVHDHNGHREQYAGAVCEDEYSEICLSKQASLLLVVMQLNSKIDFLDNLLSERIDSRKYDFFDFRDV